MIRNVLLSGIVLCLFSCSPKFVSKISNPQPVLSDQTIVVLQDTDTFTKTGVEVGTVSAGDNGFSTNCSYDEVIGTLKEQARRNGANILKITKHILPSGHGSSCDRIKATLYRVENPEQYEKVIEWTADRRLKWTDFKGDPDTLGTNKETAAATACEISFRTNWVNVFTKMKPFVTARFNCSSSWVKAEGRGRPELLRHEQAHFDLAELYARYLRQKLFEKKHTPFNALAEASAVFHEVFDAYNSRQRHFEDETSHGLNKILEAKWEQKISEELYELNQFSR